MTAGRLAWFFWGGFIVPACWRCGPKACDPDVEGRPASAQVNARVLEEEEAAAAVEEEEEEEEEGLYLRIETRRRRKRRRT
jgi:hypothetical protein